MINQSWVGVNRLETYMAGYVGESQEHTTKRPIATAANTFLPRVPKNQSGFPPNPVELEQATASDVIHSELATWHNPCEHR